MILFIFLTFETFFLVFSDKIWDYILNSDKKPTGQLCLTRKESIGELK